MSEGLRQFMVSTSDAALILLVACMLGFTVDAWRARRLNGPVVRRFAEFTAMLTVFLSWFSLVYWDRRYDIWPWHDLAAVMTAEYYWPLRLGLALTLARLWWAMRPRA